MSKRKNLTLTPWPATRHRVEVTLTPMGDKIRYRITGRVICARQEHRELPNSRTYSAEDLIWNSVFGSRLATRQFLGQNRVVKRVIEINRLGYSPCDGVGLPLPRRRPPKAEGSG